MNYAIIKKLPSPEKIIEEIPLSKAGYEQIIRDQKEVKAILSGQDSRLLMVVGPCSAWPKTAVLDYADKLLKLNESVKSHLKLIMRVYIQKPRTTKGWTGPVNQPDPLAYPNIEAGIRYARDMMVKVVEKGLAIADEALFTHSSKGFLELLSWVAIGARSTEDQEHRIFASAIDCPVGMKNPTHGSLTVAINSILAAQSTHVAVFDGYEVQTNGNPFAHLVLRGSQSGPNFSIEHLRQAQKLMAGHQIKNPSIVVDASHDNCLVEGKKDYRLQPKVIEAVMDTIQQFPEMGKLVKGFMMESFIKEGHQKVEPGRSQSIDMGGLSITDGCVGWQATEDFLLKLAERKAAYG
ncbi:MAG: 3-deoxy-7-phosphoheptulonate synthase [Proteobacteria bacterium]|nr:3-deoxy-7-phosphoheptulonate synthase [Pseudomonadota bacterium]